MAADVGPRPPRPSLVYRLMRHAGIPAMLFIWTRMCVEGRENLPPAGGYILAANHPDNLDAYCLGGTVPRTLHFLARPSGIYSRWLGRFWRLMAAVPADRDGLAEAFALLKAGEVVAVYPDGVITSQLVRAKAGVGALAVRSGAPVVPVAIWGTEKVRLWPLHGRRQLVTLRFGQPRVYTRAELRTAGLQGVADAIMREVAALLPPAYRGVYADASAAIAIVADDGAPCCAEQPSPARPAVLILSPEQPTASSEHNAYPDLEDGGISAGR